MDQALPPNKEEAFRDVAELLTTSRTYGWGGISLLWHPEAFGGGQLPIGVGRAFHALVKAASEWKDAWLSAGEFVRKVRNRYIEAGLLDPDWGADLINVDEVAQSSVESGRRRNLHVALP
jgi:hypothetical protein